MREDSFEAVALRDSVYREQTKAETFDASSEGAALRALFLDASVCKLCKSKLGAKWPDLVSAWSAWAPRSNVEVGEAVERVVVDLEAKHLKPSKILPKLQEGFAPSCYGLGTLMPKLAAAPPADAKQAAPTPTDAVER